MKFKKKNIYELNRLDPDGFRSKTKHPIILVLDNVRSAYNVGSAFRTADSFALESIHLCGITAQPPHKEIMKTAIGAEDTVDWKYFKDTADSIEELKSKDYEIIAVEQSSDSILLKNYQVAPRTKIALVFGNEVNGIDQNVLSLCDECIEIEQYGTKHSLNISVSLGIVAFALLRYFR